MSARNKYRNETNIISSNEIVEKAKNYVSKTTRVMAEYLWLIRIQIENSDGINEDNKNTIITEIDYDLVWLEEELRKIDNLTENNAIISIANSLRERWNSIKIKAKKYTGLLLVAQTRQTISKFEEVKAETEEYIVQLENNNQEVGILNNLVEEFDEKLGMTKTQITNAEKVFNKIDSAENMQTFFNQGKDFLTNTTRYFRETWQISKSAVLELNKRNLYYQELEDVESNSSSVE